MYGSEIFVAFPDAVPVQLKSPVPEPDTSMDPVAVPQVEGFEIVPDAIVGVATTLIVVTADVDVHPFPSVYVTVTGPAVETVMVELV